MIEVIKAGLAVRHRDRETQESVLQEAILHQLPRVESGLSVLAVLGAVAPLLGLLGTVTGMINTFRVITLFGTGDPKLMSGGISEALVTTELGLIVAIPIMLMHTFLPRRADHIIGDMEEKAVQLTNIIQTGSETPPLLAAGRERVVSDRLLDTFEYLAQGGWVMIPMAASSLADVGVHPRALAHLRPAGRAGHRRGRGACGWSTAGRCPTAQAACGAGCWRRLPGRPLGPRRPGPRWCCATSPSGCAASCAATWRSSPCWRRSRRCWACWARCWA